MKGKISYDYYLIVFAVLIIGIILLICDSNYRMTNTALFAVGIVCTFVGGLLAAIIIGCLIGNTAYKDLDYQNTVHEKEMLEYRIEHMEENITGNEMLYSDIVDFNNDLRSTKKWANNPWTNWFNNEYVASLDYIELAK